MRYRRSGVLEKTVRLQYSSTLLFDHSGNFDRAA